MVSCSLIGLLITTICNFQRLSDHSFVIAFEPIFILKLDNRGGVLENTFSSPWPWPRSSSSWPWPRSLQVLENVLSSA